ncbi:transposase [Archangium violaceum]|nr:transposase [Archangium violaceum]
MDRVVRFAQVESLLVEMQSRGLLHWERALVDSAHLRAPGGGRKTGPSPVDRRKRCCKHHLLTDAEGTPLALELTAANSHDITQLLKLVEAIPPVRGKPNVTGNVVLDKRTSGVV